MAVRLEVQSLRRSRAAVHWDFLNPWSATAATPYLSHGSLHRLYCTVTSWMSRPRRSLFAADARVFTTLSTTLGKNVGATAEEDPAAAAAAALERHRRAGSHRRRAALHPEGTPAPDRAPRAAADAVRARARVGLRAGHRADDRAELDGTGGTVAEGR